MADHVTIELAHPLYAEQAARLRATDVREYEIGERITVPREEAAAIINAGFASGVDPQDQGQVAAALAPLVDTVPDAVTVAPVPVSTTKKSR